MDTTEQPSLLACSICGKTFNNSRAKTRHMSYCRKKHNVALISRKKSCEKCILSKTRCIRVEQGCTRCMARNLACSFTSNTPPQNSDNVSDLDSTGLDGIDIPDVVSFDADEAVSFNDTDANMKQLTAIMNTVPQNETGWHFQKLDQNIALQGLGLNERPGTHADHALAGPSTQHYRGWRAQDMLSPMPNELLLKLHAEIPFKESASMLSKRNFSQADSVMYSELATQMLRAYPCMMKSHGSLPPFIHVQTLDLIESGAARPNPLHTVAGILEMYRNSHQSNRPFIWRLIRMEHERIWSEHQSFGKWELLSAMQEVVVHLLMRIVEGPQEYINFDSQMLYLLSTLCSSIEEKYGELILKEELDGSALSWHNWIFAESRRRTVTTVKTINVIYHADISLPCPRMPEYRVAPLPSHQAVWRACNELSWNFEYVKNITQAGPHGILCNGDLVELKSGTGYQGDKKLSWDNWYAGADALGILVMIVANLV